MAVTRSLASILLGLFLLAWLGNPALAQDEEPPLEQVLDDLSHGTTETTLEAIEVVARRPEKVEVVIERLVALLDDDRYQPWKIPIPAPPLTVGRQAAYTLASYGAASVAPVTQQLQHPQENVRRRAAMILQRIGLPEAAPAAEAIAQACEQESDESARIQMLRAYNTLEVRPAKIEALVLKALADESGQVVSTALEIVADRKLHHPEIVSWLIDAMEDERDYWISYTPDSYGQDTIRTLVGETLGRVGPPARAAADKLRRHLQSEVDISERLISAFALFRVLEGDDDALALLMSEAKNPDLLEGDSTAAIRWLGELGPAADKAWPIVARQAHLGEEHLTEETDSTEDLAWLVHSRRQVRRRTALTAADQIRGVGALSLHREALKSPLPKDREHAAKLIAEHGSQAAAAVPELILAIRDDRGDDWRSEDSRIAAAKALGSIGPPAAAAIGPLEEMATLDYASWEISFREAAEQALAKIREP